MFLFKSHFSMPVSLTPEEQQFAYQTLFGLEKPASLLGRIVYELKRFRIFLTGHLSQEAISKIDTLNEEKLHIILKCFRSNVRWTEGQERKQYLQTFAQKKFHFLTSEILLETQPRLIINVCASGNSILLNEVLKLEVKNDLNQVVQGYQFTPLMVAAQKGNFEIVQFLSQQDSLELEKEVTDLAQNTTDALEQAAMGNNFQCIKLLLENGKFSDDSIFRAIKASINRGMSDIETMLDKLVILDETKARELLYLVLQVENQDLFKRLLSSPKIVPYLKPAFVESLDSELKKDVKTKEREKRYYKEQAQQMLADSWNKALRIRAFFGTYTLRYRYNATRLKNAFLYPNSTSTHLLNDDFIRAKLQENPSLRQEITESLKESLRQADSPTIRLELSDVTRNFYHEALQYLNAF